MYTKINNKFFSNSSLSFKILVWFLLLSLVPIIIVSIYSYKQNNIKLKKAAIIKLQHSLELQKRYLHNWFNFRKAGVLSWSKMFDIDHMQTIQKNYPSVYDIYKITKEGDISYSFKKEKDFNTNLLNGPYSNTKFANAFKQTLKDKKLHFSDLEYYEPSNGIIAGFITAPLFDKKGDLIGVFAVHIILDNIFSLFKEDKLQRSYLIGDDGLLRTNISKDKQALKYKVDLSILNDDVLSIHKIVNIFGVNWILVNEIDYDIIYENTKEYLNNLLMFLFFTTIIIYLVARYISLQITKPINSLIEASKSIAKGDCTKKIDIDTNDEIQHLVNSFNAMSNELSATQQKIKEQKDSFEILYQKSTDGIFLIENEKFIDCNESVLKMFKYKDKNSFLNHHPSELSPTYQPDGKLSLEKANEIMNTTLKEGSYTFEWLHTKTDGEEFWTEIVLTKIVQNSKGIIHAVLRDVQKRKETEKQLEELTKDLELRIKYEVAKNIKKDKQMFYQSRLAQMGEMISMIAHQWRQPLGAISSTTIDLKFKLELGIFDLENKKARENFIKYFDNALDDIEELIQTLSITIDDFRNFYKPNKEKKSLSINEPIIKALKIIETSLVIDNIKVIKVYDSKKIFKIFDSEVMQVILNILNNAQDNFNTRNINNAMIKIVTQDTYNGVKIAIYDNGGGIEVDVIDKIFDPYFSTKHDKNGTGLGLYMSKIIIEEHHNGEIYAQNIDGGGVCFIIEFEDNDST